MPSLIVIGNTNIHTFSNSVIAANAKAKELFGTPLGDVFILHSPESSKIIDHNPDLQDFFSNEGMEMDNFLGKIIKFSPDENSIKKFVHHIEFILKGIHNSNELILDLSNGTITQRNLLSIVGYVLDVKHQYMIDTAKLIQLTDLKGFIALDFLIQAYVPTPDSALIDKIAYLNLSEIIRYKQVIKQHTEKFIEIDTKNSDDKFFSSNLHQSIRIKLDGDKKKRQCDISNCLYIHFGKY